MEQSSDERARTGTPDAADGTAVPQPLETLLATIPEPVVVTDAAGEVVAGNPAFEAVFERLPTGEALTELFPDLSPEAVEENCAAGAGEYVTARTEGDRWVELSFGRHRWDGRAFAVGVVHDVTARHEHEQLREQYERILETIEDGIYTLDESFTIQTVNGAVESMTGYDRSELVGESATLLADDSVIDRAARLSEELLAGERDVATLTTDLATADGETLPIETRFSTYRRDDGTHRQVGVVRDISDRRRFERTLASLHDSTRELFGAQTTDDVAALVAESAAGAPDVDGAAIYRFDGDANVLSPAAVAGTVADDCPELGPRSCPLWETFVEGEVLTAGAGAVPVDPGTGTGGVCLPLGEYGVLYAVTDAGRESDTVEVLSLLAASAEAALARVDREQTLRERDEELKRQNARLRQLEEVNAIIRRIDRVLVDADTCAEIEQAVCDRLVDSRWFAFAWVGRPDRTQLDPAAWAGTAPAYLDEISLSTDGEGGPPSVRTARSDEMTVVTSIADDIRSEPWRAAAVSANFQSALSVPLRDDEFTYGVLTVYGTPEASFGEMFRSVLAELGETIANAIREVESRRRRSAPAVVELDVSVSAPNTPLGRLAAALGTPVSCEGVVPEAGDTTRLFVRAAVDECRADLACLESVSAISDGDDPLFEAVVSGTTVADTLLDQGAHVASLTARPDGETVVATVRLSAGTDVRAFVERLDGHYGSASLVARRERDLPSSTGGLRATIEERLTDRQMQVLRTAYLSGFFDWPRKSTGTALAERLGISQPTMSRHLRVGERKLLELVFEDS